MSNVENSAYLQVLTGLFPCLTLTPHQSVGFEVFENKVILTFGLFKSDS